MTAFVCVGDKLSDEEEGRFLDGGSFDFNTSGSLFMYSSGGFRGRGGGRGGKGTAGKSVHKKCKMMQRKSISPLKI